jgi:hypothetical protein
MVQTSLDWFRRSSDQCAESERWSQRSDIVQTSWSDMPCDKPVRRLKRDLTVETYVGMCLLL